MTVSKNATSLPRIVWILWWQGIETAPTVVRRCINSWRNRNPGWDIRVLDAVSARQYATIDELFDNGKSPSPQVQANLLRLKLLDQYGGVWADATCYCSKPLDAWLNEHMQSGFFAFSSPHRARLMANWFIAATPENYLVHTLRKHYSEFFINNDVSLHGRFRYLPWALGLLLNRFSSLTCIWFHPLLVRGLKVYPYFCFHYMFAELVRNDPEFRKIWNATQKIPARDPHMLQNLGLLSEVSDWVKEEIRAKRTPVHKLNWRVAEAQLTDRTNLGYFFHADSMQ